MSRSVLSPHVQRLRLNTFALLLITGTPQQVIDHVDQQVDNKMNLVAAGVHKAGNKAMALTIDGQDFDGNIDEARETALSSDVVKAILGGYGTDRKWSFISMLTAGKDKLDVAIGGNFLGQIQAVTQFVKDFARAVYGRGSSIAGSTSQTKTLLLFAPDTERNILAWNYETGRDVALSQPYGENITRYSVAGNTLLAVQAGEGQLKTMSFKQIQANIDNANIGNQDDWKTAPALKGVQIDDLTIGNNIGGNTYAVIASGTFLGKQGLKVFNVTADSDSIRVLPTAQATIELDEDTLSYGSPVRYDETSVTFVNRNGGSNTITRIALDALPAQVKSAFTQQASA